MFTGRIPEPDLPVSAVRFLPEHLDISAQIEHGARNTLLLKKFDDPLGCVPLGDPAQIDLRSFRQTDLACLCVKFNSGSIYVRDGFRKDFSVRNIDRRILLFNKVLIVIEIRKSPDLHDRVDRNVKRAVRHLIN